MPTPSAPRPATDGEGHTFSMPPYKPKSKLQSEKGEDGMYPFTNLDFTARDIKAKSGGILAPLTLFAPYSHEDEPPSDIMELDRPVTPINDEIKSAPQYFDTLAKLVRRRISANPDIGHLEEEDQKALAAVIMGEVTTIWPDLRMQVNDPFLNKNENKELQRRVTVHIVTVCERLFLHYVQKAQILNRRGIFSGPANMSRLKAQLALETNKFLNVLTIRRYIVGDMRSQRDDSSPTYSADKQRDLSSLRPSSPKQPTPPTLSFQGLTAASRSISKSRKFKLSTANEDLKEISANMPNLDTSRLLGILDNMPHTSRLQSRASENGESSASKQDPELPRKTSGELTRDKVTLKRSDSLPQLHPYETLYEEFDIEEEEGRESAASIRPEDLPASPRNQETIFRDKKEEERVKTAEIKKIGTPRDHISQDLEQLLTRQVDQDAVIPGEEMDDDMPPLIQALTRSAKHDGKRLILERQLKELEIREKQRVERESVLIKGPTHPQPATVKSKLPNQMVVKASDIRVSERVCLSSITLKKSTTVYNDLTEEYSIKWRDVGDMMGVGFRQRNGQPLDLDWNEGSGSEGSLYKTKSNVKYREGSKRQEKLLWIREGKSRGSKEAATNRDKSRGTKEAATNRDKSRGTKEGATNRDKSRGTKEAATNRDKSRGTKEAATNRDKSRGTKEGAAVVKGIGTCREKLLGEEKDDTPPWEIVQKQFGRDPRKQISPAWVKKLDSNLFLGDEITEVYQEIMKTVSSDHLRLEEDDEIEPTADSINLSAAMPSASLTKKPSERIINPKLHHSTNPPWGDQDAKDWAKIPAFLPKDSQRNPGLDPTAPGGGMMGETGGFGGEDETQGGAAKKEDMPSHMQDFMARSYASWLMWWKNTINSDDYMKYLSSQESDYMGVVFHFYNSDDEEEEDEDESTAKHASKHASKQALLEERERKLGELRSQKAVFKDGLWNVNSVLMGGLGKDPQLEDDLADVTTKTSSISEQAQSLSVDRSRTKVISRKSQKSLLTVNEMDAQMKSKDLDLHMTATTPITSQSISKGNSESKKDSQMTLSPQDRLERVWTSLQLPDGFKLDMAIKYSSDDFHHKMEQAIEAWEQATELVLRREGLIGKLEKFEWMASDPNRFFERGQRGSSVARLEEAKARSHLYKRIDGIDVELTNLLERIKDEFNDTVTFQGRPYIDKMKWDRVEMLYWLQEERKQHAMDMESRMKNIPLSMVQLDPITPQMQTA